MMRQFLLAAGVLALLAPNAFAATAQPEAPKATAAKAPPAAAKPAAAPAAGTPTGGDDRPKRIGEAQSWDAYSYLDKGVRVCYAISKPTKTDPSITRKEVQALVTHRFGQAANVVNFVVGYPLKPGSSAAVDIDGKSFDFFTKDDGAWSRDADTDKNVVNTMAKGKVILVKGSPAKGGKDTSDSYSLTGFSKMLTAIDQACNVKR